MQLQGAFLHGASLAAQTVKHLPAMWETQVRSLGQEDPLEKDMATHSSILAWKIPQMEKPGRLQSVGSQRVGHNWVTSLSFPFSVKREAWNVVLIILSLSTVAVNTASLSNWSGNEKLREDRLCNTHQHFSFEEEALLSVPPLFLLMWGEELLL